MPWMRTAILLLNLVSAAAADESPGASDAAAASQAAPEQSAPQQAAPAPLPAEQPPAPGFPIQPPPSDQSGFLRQVGRWWQKAVTHLDDRAKESQSKMRDLNARANQAATEASAASEEALKNATQAASDAATAMVRLPNARIVELRERCLAADNGAPDCRGAAAAACRGKGFNNGQPVDIRTAQVCPASVWLSGQAPGDRECPRETVVTRAVCQ